MDTISWPVEPGTVRHPRWRILVGGTPLSGCESVEIHATGHRKASTVSARFSLGADPSLLATWADAQPPISLEVQAAFLVDSQSEEQAVWQSAFVGDVSDIHIDLPNGSVDVTGRDLAGRLIDGRTRETFANQSSSEIAHTIAGRFGLTADVDATTTRAGSYYQLEHDKLVNDSFSKTTTYWDLLSYLAKHENFDLWVDGKTLHFKKAVDIATVQPVPLVWSPASDTVAYPSIPVADIQLRRSCTLGKGIKVIVKTWNSKQKHSSEISYPASAAKDAQEYVYVRPGWSPERALQYAQSEYSDILRHERSVDITMPGELSMTPRSIVSLAGTGTSFDTRYFVDELSREFSLDGGFTQHVVLKNHPVQSDADVS